MRRVRLLGFLLALGLAACGARPPRLTIPEFELSAPQPSSRPEVAPVTPHLVRYPGLDVAYVANGEGDIYYCRGLYYTFFDGHWFQARRVRGPWEFIEMKYVPSDCFRVRGQLPPGIER